MTEPPLVGGKGWETYCSGSTR